MALLLWLLVLHVCGDHLCKTHQMRAQKATSWWVLTEHVAIYTTVLTYGVLGSLTRLAVTGSRRAVLWVPLVFAAHFLVDAVTSRTVARYRPGRWLPAVLTVDQALHVGALVLSARLMGWV